MTFWGVEVRSKNLKESCEINRFIISCCLVNCNFKRLILQVDTKELEHVSKFYFNEGLHVGSSLPVDPESIKSKASLSSMISLLGIPVERKLSALKT